MDRGPGRSRPKEAAHRTHCKEGEHERNRVRHATVVLGKENTVSIRGAHVGDGEDPTHHTPSNGDENQHDVDVAVGGRPNVG